MRSAEDLLNGIKVVLAEAVVVCALAGAAFGDYCSASGGSTDIHISGVEVGDIKNTGTGADSYVDYTELSTKMEIRGSYGITVTNGAPYNQYDQCGVWVDWNGDEDFDDVNETIVISGGPETFTGTISPPKGTALGSTRMRVRIRWIGALEPCGDTLYGEVEDYTIVVIEEKPYEIWTAADLQAIGADANYWDRPFLLMADIDLGGYTGTSYNIIGRGLTRFTGVFDGNGHMISNLTYSDPGAGTIGMFGRVDHEKAEIKNLILVNPNIDAGTTGSTIGSLVGVLSKGSITGCVVEGGSVSGNELVGGLVGYNGGEIDGCYSASDVIGNKFVGGLVGFSKGSIANSYSKGSVSSADSYPWYVGGLAGYNPGEIDRCYSASDVIGYQFVGGLVGNNAGTISSSCSTGTVLGIGRTGGLTGFNYEGYIVNCYSTGSVYGGSGVGGLVGQNHFGSVSNSYSASSLEGGNYVGGLSGGSTGGTYTNYTKCFWDVNVNPDVNGIWNADDPNVIGKTTANMQTESTFTDAGWDFTSPVWTIDEGMDYPRLAWESGIMLASIDMDEVWMYQSLPGQDNSDLTAGVSVTDDPWSNSSYSYEWEIILPGDVTLAPVTVDGGGAGDAYWTFASRGCDEPGGLSDSGQTFTVRVTVTGGDYGNTGQAEAEFGIALLGDINNDGVVNVADRSIANAFWRTGSAGAYTLRDCDVNCDGVVNVADRSIANAIWRGILGQNSVSSPCPLR